MDWEHANAANLTAFPSGDAVFGNIPLFDGFSTPMMGLGSPVELKVEEDAPPQPQYQFPRTSLSVQVPTPQVQQPAPMDGESMSPNNSSDDDEEEEQPRHGTKRVRRSRVMQHRFTERVRREATNDILEQLKTLTGNNAKKKLDVLRAAAVALRKQAAANEALRQQCAELERQQALQDLSPPSPTSLSVGSMGSTENSSFSMPQHHQQLTDARDQLATMDSKAMAGSLVWNCGIGIVMATVTMQCIAMNEFFRSFTGYSDEDLNLGLTCTQLLKADEIGDIYAVMGLLMADKCRAVHIPAKVILTKSGPIWCNVTLTVSRDDASNKLLIAFISPLAVQTEAPPVAQRAIQVS